MDDNNEKWTKLTLFVLSFPFVFFAVIIFVPALILTIINAGNDTAAESASEIFSNQAGKMIDIEKKARQEEKKRFLQYQVVDIPEDSKERIAVRFNTMDGKNIGIIDEHGNVIKEPFLYDRINCYCDDYFTFDKYINYGNYIDLTNYGGGIYNLNLEPVTLSEQEEEAYDKLIHSKGRYINYDDKVHTKETEKIYQYFKNPEDYELTNLDQKGENGIYTANMFKEGKSSNNIIILLLDENYDLATHFYYRPNNGLMLSPPSADSKVGAVYVSYFGLVYFNLDGEIIWITYCDQNLYSGRK